MWKAVGGDKSQQPFAWLRLPHTVKFIDSLKKKLNTGKIPVLKTLKGRYGGTYAHWQIAPVNSGEPGLQGSLVVYGRGVPKGGW